MWCALNTIHYHFEKSHLDIVDMCSTTRCDCVHRLYSIREVTAAGATGQLSLVTSFLNAIGCVARVFTTVQEVNDKVILAGWVVATVLNMMVLALFFIYPRTAETAKKIN